MGFIRGHSSSDNIRRLVDIMWSGDMVEWGILFKVLEEFRFGATFIKWIHVSYRYPEAAVQTNGLTSDYFMLGRGTRQGSPLSPLLFCLAIELLAASICGSIDFLGVTISGKVHKMTLYADDILLLVSGPADLCLVFLES